ncbi:CCA tRNA nucleotidyltransferase [Chlamydiifrater phoenicopteri]|uniref:CCA tRNA nucleotidyltransferase n=1 Tax=Chlamydiifrater phoenicopteri TaxID=2681469 RepID=UPI001BCE2C36|nr:CCA tRNA nucleotidyltransferase [Chlamydiifrater phoenicopteri]
MMSDRFESAKKIITVLKNADCEAFFVGGCVRDMIMGLPIGDIDIATNASPVLISTLFPDTIAIGAAFGIIVVKQDGALFEVATFRSDGSYSDGRHPDRIVFSSMKEDALRRDFTINGLFYDPFTDKIFDYVDGIKDIERKIIRAIGHPRVRFTEDKLRILRAARFSSRLGFSIEPSTRKAILKEVDTLTASVSPERIWQELKKIATFPNLYQAVALLEELKILQTVFPELKTLPLTSVKKAMRCLERLETPLPPILYYLPLFAGLSTADKKAIFLRLKVSSKELDLIEAWDEAFLEFSKKNINRVFWAHFFASSKAEFFLPLYGALLAQEESRKDFTAKTSRLKQELYPFTMRIKTKRPVVVAADLIARGVAPGRLLGDLLKEAETLSIEKNCQNKEEILHLLKAHGFWK